MAALTTPHALMRGIPHPRGLGFLLHCQNQRPNSTGLTSHLSDGTVLQIQKPVTNNSLTNKMKNIKRSKKRNKRYRWAIGLNESQRRLYQ